VCAALGDDDAADKRGAARTRLSGSGIDLVPVLEGSALTTGVHIVGNRGTAGGESLDENLLNRRVQAFEPNGTEAGGRRQRMEAGEEKCLVHINIAKAGKDGLVEEKDLQAAASGTEAGGQSLGGEIEGVRTKAGGIHPGGPPAEAAKLADVVEDEQILLEFQQGAGMGAGGGIPEEFAGHAEVDVEGTGIEAEEEVFAQAVEAGDASAGETGGEFGGLVVGCVGGEEARGGDDAAGEQGREGAADGFDFGEFRHGIQGVGRG
jgi:hypothetical protein